MVDISLSPLDEIKAIKIYLVYSLLKSYSYYEYLYHRMESQVPTIFEEDVNEDN